MSKSLLVFGSYVAAALSVLIGIFSFSTIPKELGFYRFLSRLQPAAIGLTPAFHYGIPWKYTWEEFYKQNDLSGQTAIVTGSNSGIGFDLSMALAQVGVSVTMVCRNPTKCETARQQIIRQVGSKAKVQTMTMDTASLASVQAFAKAFSQEHKEAIDMLFLNAGTLYRLARGESAKCSRKTNDGLEYLFQVNYLSHHLLYRLLEPQLAPQAHIIQTSSFMSFSSFSYKVATNLQTLHGCSEPFVKHSINLSYGQSKLAQILWVKALTRRNSNVYANVCSPGWVDTPIMGKMLDSQKAGDWTRKMFGTFLGSAWKSPDGALTGLYLGVNPQSVRGQYYHPQAQLVVHPLALDEQLASNLWDFSDQLVRDYLPQHLREKIEKPQESCENPPTHNRQRKKKKKKQLYRKLLLGSSRYNRRSSLPRRRHLPLSARRKMGSSLLQRRRSRLSSSARRKQKTKLQQQKKRRTRKAPRTRRKKR